MGGWGTLAGAVIAIEVILGRTGRPYLSHEAWDLVESDNGWLAWLAVSSVGYHLLAPRRRWRQAVALGLAVGLAHRATTRTLRFERLHIP